MNGKLHSNGGRIALPSEAHEAPARRVPKQRSRTEPETPDGRLRFRVENP